MYGQALSPFLIIIVGEALSGMLDKAKQADLIRGFSCDCGNLLVSHLQFANATLLFYDAKVGQMVNAKGHLKMF